jgi:serine/threonine-protein kinase
MSAWTVPSYAEGWSVPGYVEERLLGQGASGRVVAAVSTATGQRVAIKYLSPALVRDPAFMWIFRSEAQTLRALDVPQVVQLFDYVEEPGQGAAIVMELVDGVSLHDLITQRGPTTPESALMVLKGSLLGLSAAHALGVVHRDYKPENVLVDTQGDSKLADFGIAVKAGKKALAAGTPLYMAPEQWNGAPNSPATDVYAATAVFFECLTGSTPFSGKLGLLRQQHETAMVPVSLVAPPLQSLLLRGMAKNPVDRPQSAIAFVGELEATAATAYGPDWEERGRSQLAERVAALLPLLLLHGGSGGAGGTSSASTWLGGGGGGRRPRRAVAIGAITAVAVVAVAAVATAVTLDRSHHAGLQSSANNGTAAAAFTAQAAVNPPVTSSQCTTLTAFSYKGTLSATAPGTVRYQWVYSSGDTSSVQTVKFTAAGRQHVTGATVRTRQAGAGWAEIKLLGPAGISNRAGYKLLCGQNGSGITPVASIDTPTKVVACGTATPTFTATGTITAKKAGPVSYYWALANGQDSAPATLTFGKPGTQAAAPLTITPPGDTASGQAVLVVTKPSAVTSSPAPYSVSCTTAQQVSSVAKASPASETLASCSTAAPAITFSGTITATQAGTVNYYWKLPSGNGPAQSLYFPQAGSGAVNTATYKPASASASGSGSIVVTSPGAGASSAASFKLSCGAALALKSSAAATATVGTAYTGTATVTGGKGSYTWTVTGLPAGLKSSATAGTLSISGTPTATGAAAVKLSVSDGNTPKGTASDSFTLTVSASTLKLAGGALTAGKVGTAYSATVAATGGTAPYTYTATGLPAGLAMSAAGVISGTPTAAATSSVTVTVTDSTATKQTATGAYSLTIAALPKPALAGGTLTAAASGAAYSATVAASGGTPGYTYTATGLPGTLTMSSAGTISGTAPSERAAASFSVTVTVTDAAKQTATATYTLPVSAGVVVS